MTLAEDIERVYASAANVALDYDMGYRDLDAVVVPEDVPELVGKELYRMVQFLRQEANLQGDPKSHRAMSTAAQVLETRADQLKKGLALRS